MTLSIETPSLKMADTIRGAVDFDLMLHFGSLHNVDIYEKGIYFIQVTMKYGYDGRQKVAPVGVFSAPSMYDSFVGVSEECNMEY